jgi:hypothetical protein
MQEQGLIKVTVELWPHGRSEEAQPLGMAFIINDGTGDDAQGSYEAVFSRVGTDHWKPETRRVVINGFDRSQDLWHLLHAALDRLKEQK